MMFRLNLPQRSRRSTRGFTLVEMLVAMAITLLLMAALARAFGFVGTRIRESRADTSLASSLRDITTRLSDELSQCTVSLQPNMGEAQDPLGYFVYYEGPVTNVTSSMFRATTDASGNLVLNDSKVGDFDDYIAFTAVAKGNNWFTGKVPRYILDRKSREIDPTFPATPAARAFDPVVIRSKYAEIIYFASPEYSQASLLASNPAYIDVDGDVDLNADGDASENGLPDRLRIHRRVLLIRPDLNLNTGVLPIQNNGTADFMRADAWPDAVAAPATGAPPPGATVRSTADTSLGWLYGMAGVHQQCDLSLRRVLNAAGLPTGNVAANSLADLSKPHNRFGFVRVPDTVLTGGTGNVPTSMPVLALGGPATILNTLTTSNAARIAPPATPSNGPVVMPNALCGFLRPEFVLGNDLTHLDLSGTLWSTDRIGEDLVTNNVVGFDVQVYDPAASFFTTYDTSGSPTGPVVGPSDAGYRDALAQAIQRAQAGASATPAVPLDNAITRQRGGYVDLAYPVLAGGALRGWQARRLDRRSGANGPGFGTLGGFLVTPFSSIARYGGGDVSLYDPTQTPPNWVYQPSFYRSGRIVTTGNTIRLFQPAFDTFTSFYERDGFLQGSNAGDSGTRWSVNTTTNVVDLGTDGLDNDQLFGPDDQGERETSAPFINRPESIRVTIRIENPATRQLRQSSVVHRDQL